jgi:two-component system, chemotaxis family, CheB/CheR fusion protein
MSSPEQQASVPVASIGASAGGIAALQTFFEALPDRVGAAFVVIVHLDPEHGSELCRIIGARTRMPVVEVTQDRVLEPDTVYVIPPNRRLQVSAAQISSAPFDEPRGQRSPIDLFFRSVAEQHGDGFAIILTGAGSDGAVGVKAVKERGGLILVQDPNEAEYPSMPRSAIASGVADFVLPVHEIAARLPELVRQKQQFRAEELADKDEQSLTRVLAYLKMKSGHDFSHYKRATILRRLGRRMQVTRTETLEEYLAHLRSQPEEATALLADLLISVTSFFRDASAFQELARSVIPRLFDTRAEGEGIRVWVPGCATGEEVYSVAILLLEESARRDERPEIQLFASDLDATALATAREGSYPMAIQADVSEERLRRFFAREGDHYRIRREVRDLVVFAQHSLLKDPPFSHIDLISCRNLLIYLDRDLQSQVCATFHYALRPNGYLFVGSSENIERHTLFKVVNRDARIFQALERPRELPPLPRVITGPRLPELPPLAGGYREARSNYGNEHRQALEQTAPPSMLVDEAHRILNLSETAGRFLLQPGGPLSTVAVDIVRAELKLDLQASLHRAFEQGQPTLTLPMAVQFNGGAHQVSLYVRSIRKDGAAPLALVLFLEAGPARSQVGQPALQDGNDSQLVAQLRNELSATQAHLRASREQYETITEELRASNEELQSINEEYRSTAEELETSKEELQSINEELQTLNNELKLKLDAVSRAHNDLQNLMSSTDVATLFLNTALRINRFTPRLADIFSVAAGDEGRPIGDFTHRLEYAELIADAQRVLSDLAPVERTLRTHDGHWYLMRMRPYRTLDDKIEGVVVTFVDVTERREAEAKWESRQKRLLGELSHRVKINLGLVQSIVNQTLPGSGASEAAQAALTSRLQAVARTQDLLVNSEWNGTDLAAIAGEHLAERLAEKPSRLVIEGPAINLPSDIATPFGLILNELARNAASHGAWSTPGGRVRLAWEVIEADRGRRLKLVWSEEGGSPGRAPQQAAYDGYAIERDIPAAHVKRERTSTGFVCTIELPVASMAVQRS